MIDSKVTAFFVLGRFCLVHCVCVCVYPFSREGGINPILGITEVQFFQTELRPVMRVSADPNLNRFHQKELKARRKPTINMGEFRVAKPIALGV